MFSTMSMPVTTTMTFAIAVTMLAFTFAMQHVPTRLKHDTKHYLDLTLRKQSSPMLSLWHARRVSVMTSDIVAGIIPIIIYLVAVSVIVLVEKLKL